MKTPIVNFVKAYANSGPLRLHMPGHKGIPFLGIEKWDITEISGADVLYNAHSIIKKSEDNAASVFGTAKTLYSTEGSTLAMRAMLYLVRMFAKRMEKRPLIAAARNVHKTFMTTAALLDLDVDWIFPENPETVLSCTVTPNALEEFLSRHDERPVAVYLTSPDYLGNLADIKGLAQVCHRHGVLLLVDNAHGAYLKFLQPSLHPISLGADMCCDSAHKTLPVLTGGAYLHISQDAPTWFSSQAETALSVFASTSPSYLILQSLDLVNRYVTGSYTTQLEQFAGAVKGLKSTLLSKEYTLIGDEPLKITIAPKSMGYTGIELADRLAEHNIVCEFSDPDFTVLMLTPEIGAKGLSRLQKALCAVEKKEPILSSPPTPARPVQILSLKDALFSPSSELELQQCRGKVLAEASVICPPAIPIVVCGEQIDETAIQCFEYYGITTCRVISTPSDKLMDSPQQR